MLVQMWEEAALCTLLWRETGVQCPKIIGRVGCENTGHAAVGILSDTKLPISHYVSRPYIARKGEQYQPLWSVPIPY